MRLPIVDHENHKKSTIFFGGFHSHGGYPKNRLFIRGHASDKWMRTRASGYPPIGGNQPFLSLGILRMTSHQSPCPSQPPFASVAPGERRERKAWEKPFPRSSWTQKAILETPSTGRSKKDMWLSPSTFEKRWLILDILKENNPFPSIQTRGFSNIKGENKNYQLLGNLMGFHWDIQDWHMLSISTCRIFLAYFLLIKIGNSHSLKVTWGDTIFPQFLVFVCFRFPPEMKWILVASTGLRVFHQNGMNDLW